MSLLRPNSCNSCTFASRDAGKMFCRFNPPSSHPLIGNVQGKPVFAGSMTMFPEIRPDMWCGQYRKGLVTLDDEVSPFSLAAGVNGK